jgi:phytoene dehydrogenase-like protein
MTPERYQAIVIGADLNGLTTAAYLAKAGLRVLLLEPRDTPGRELSTEEIAPGFRLDACVHDAGWIPSEILRDLSISHVQREILRPDPAVLAPDTDGGHLTFWRDPERTSDEIAKRSPEDARRWIPFMRQLRRLATFLESVYRAAPPSPLGTTVRDALTLFRLARRLRGLGRRDMTELLRVLPMPVADLLDDWFESDLLKGTLGCCGATGIFQGPRSGGTAFVLLHHLVGADAGVFRPRGLVRGGVSKLAEAFSTALRAWGGEIRYGVPVERLVMDDGRVSGVVTADGIRYAAERVVSSLDPARTFLELADHSYVNPEFLRAVRQIKFRGAWAKVNLALGELPRFAHTGAAGQALGGVICISPGIDYLERAYDAAKHGTISHHPYLEATIPSLHDPALAPLLYERWPNTLQTFPPPFCIARFSPRATWRCSMACQRGMSTRGSSPSTKCSSCVRWQVGERTGCRFPASFSADRARTRAGGSPAVPVATPLARSFEISRPDVRPRRDRPAPQRLIRFRPPVFAR